MRSGRRDPVQDDKRFHGCCPKTCEDALWMSNRNGAYVVLIITCGRRGRPATSAGYRGSRMRQIVLKDVCSCVAAINIVS